MNRDYDTIHFIQDQMDRLDDKVIATVVRMYNRLEERQCYASALSTSISLFLAFKYLELEPKLVLGTIQYQGLSYPHAWIELDDKIFDLATHEDVKYHPVLMDRELKMVEPQVNIGYEEASKEICYYPFQFGDMWELSNMRKLVGKTFEEYANEAPMFDIWGDVCYILNISAVREELGYLKAIAKLETISDKEE